jgi:guanine deaminase
MDQRCPEALALPRKEAMEACRRLIAAWHDHDDGRLQFVVTPRFALSCSRALMEDAAELARAHNLRIQTHLAETTDEVSAVLAEHPFAKDYLGVYEAVGLAGNQAVYAHAIHLSPSEWDRIADQKAKIAHCPDSNFFLGSGRMPISEARRRHIAVGLGTDVGAGRSFALGRAMSAAHDNALCLASRVAPEELFSMATLVGAKVLGLEQTVGSLEEGKSADFLVVHVDQVEGRVKEAEEVLAALVFSEATTVVRTFVRGKQIFRALAPGAPGVARC